MTKEPTFQDFSPQLLIMVPRKTIKNSKCVVVRHNESQNPTSRPEAYLERDCSTRFLQADTPSFLQSHSQRLEQNGGYTSYEWLRKGGGVAICKNPVLLLTPGLPLLKTPLFLSSLKLFI